MKETSKDFQLQYAKKIFKNHKAKYIDIGKMAVIDWQDVDESKDFYVRYIIDKELNKLYISGNLGSCIVDISMVEGIKDIVSYIENIDSFINIFECSTDSYIFDEDLAKEQIVKKIPYCNSEFLDSCVEDFSIYEGLSANAINLIKVYDRNCEIWVANVGKYFDFRVVLWLVGLKMAYRQLNGIVNLS